MRAWKEWSRHAWLHAMHVLMRSGVPAAALVSRNGSARNGRAIETRSAAPLSRMASAISGVLMRLVATSGMETEPRSLAVTHEKPPRGTLAAIVGMRASCHPIPVLINDAPADSMACARASTSCQSEPFSTRSSIERRNMRMKSGRVAARTRSTIVVARRVRLAKEPPHSSVRALVRAAMNWLIRYPSLPITSTPS